MTPTITLTFDVAHDDVAQVARLIYALEQDLANSDDPTAHLREATAGAQDDGQPAAAEPKAEQWDSHPDAREDVTPAPAALDDEPAPSGNGGSPSERRARTLDAIRSGFRLHHDQAGADAWTGSGAIAALSGIGDGTVSKACRELLDAGELEHNGKGGAWSRFRLRTDAPATQPTTTPPAPPVERKLSPRVAKLVAEERDTPRASSPAANPELAALEAKVLGVLTRRPSTIPELAAGLVAHRASVASVVAALDASGRLERDGRRQGDVIYRETSA